MKHKLTAIGYHTAFNNEQSSNRKVSDTRPQNDKCKTTKTRKLTANLKKRIMNENTTTNDKH